MALWVWVVNKRNFIFLNMYFIETKKFYYSFFFVLPFLIIYEIGLWQNLLGMKLNGADALLRFFFYFLFSIVGIHATKWVVGGIVFFLLLIFIYYLVQNKIKIRWHFLGVMVFESIVIAFLLSIAISFVLNRKLPVLFSFQVNPSIQEQLQLNGFSTFWSKIVASFGAGIFEEFLFRVIALRVLYSIFSRYNQSAFSQDVSAAVKAIFFGSFIFTLMHIGALGSIGGYFSIFLASVFLSAIYIKRGYGIVAISHSFYDIFLMFGVVA